MASQSDLSKSGRPDNVPADRVVDFDLYNPPGVEAGFHEAWQRLHAPGVPNLVWTPHNGGHWMATRGEMLAEVFSDYERFSCRVMLVPKSVGEQHQMLPVVLAHRIHDGAVFGQDWRSTTLVA